MTTPPRETLSRPGSTVPKGAPVSGRFAIAWAVLIAVALGLLGQASQVLDIGSWLRAPDAWTYDARTALLSPRVGQPRNDILVVTVDETSMARYPFISPVNRAMTAEIVRGLEDAGAKVIGLDFVLDTPTTQADDAALMGALKAAGIPVVLGALDERFAMRDRSPEEGLDQQEAFIAGTGKPAGHLYFFSRSRSAQLEIGDNVVRHRLGPSPIAPNRRAFAAEIAEAAGVSVPAMTPEDEPRLIAWQRPPAGGLSRYPFPVLRVKPHAPGALVNDMFLPGWQEAVRGRIVLIGGSFGDRDRHRTPFSVLDGKADPGVTIHAQILAQLIDGREVATLPGWLEAVLVFALALLGWWAGKRTWRVGLFGGYDLRPDPGGLVEGVFVAAVLILLGGLVYLAFGLIIPSATIFIAFLSGLLIGNPPHWLAWALGKTGLQRPG